MTAQRTIDEGKIAIGEGESSARLGRTAVLIGIYLIS